ncbi:MAG: YIP1 family protein [Holophagaceae bacterium]|nr:YIP1 family protein [Holophagaceae bacterium]
MIEDFPSNPYAPPEAPLELEQEDRNGLRPIPFEDRDAVPGFWRRVGLMFKLLFTDPYSFYDRMGVTSGLGAPFRFLAVMLLPVIAFIMLIFGVLGLTTMFGSGAKGNEPAWMLPVVMGGMALIYPPMIAVSTAVWGLLNHACLWMWRGTERSAGLGQTIRATVYTYAFILIGSFIPLVGLFAALGGAVLLGIGLARLHRTDMWRGIVAVFTPLVLCCGLYAAFIAFAIAGGGFK